MSFSSDAKAEIIEQQFSHPCCRRAFLEGVLSSRGELVGDDILITVENDILAEYIKELIRENYSKDGEIKTSKRGGRCRVLTFSSNSAKKYIEQFKQSELFYTKKCDGCLSSYLRGVFFASGRMSDPHKQYLLPFSVKEPKDRLFSFFESIGLSPHITKKKNEELIYFKNSANIEDFFTLASMYNTTFEVMNAKIEGEIRNKANRVSNCETNNIGKAVAASYGQIAIISELIEKGLISQLPDELEMTARLRMEHSEMSLSQLAGIITPHISKPGLSHRLKKITELGTVLLERYAKRSGE